MQKLWAGMAALAAFGAVTASAASLGGLTTDKVGADDVTVAACDTDGLTTTYTTAYESTLPGYEVATVTVGGIAAACNGDTMRVTLVNSSNASLGEVTLTVSSDGGADTSDDADFTTDNVLAENVTAIHVSING